MTAPQIIAAVWLGLLLVLAVALDGHERTGKFNGLRIVITTSLWALLLYWGGFWS